MLLLNLNSLHNLDMKVSKLQFQQIAIVNPRCLVFFTELLQWVSATSVSTMFELSGDLGICLLIICKYPPE